MNICKVKVAPLLGCRSQGSERQKSWDWLLEQFWGHLYQPHTMIAWKHEHQALKRGRSVCTEVMVIVPELSWSEHTGNSDTKQLSRGRTASSRTVGPCLSFHRCTPGVQCSAWHRAGSWEIFTEGRKKWLVTINHKGKENNEKCSKS